MSKALVIALGGSWSSILERLRKNPLITTVHMDTSRTSLQASPVDERFKFALGKENGTGEAVFESFSYLTIENFLPTQILNKLVCSVPDVKVIIPLVGVNPASASTALADVLATAIKTHPMLSSVPLVPIVVTQQSKLSTDKQAYATLTSLMFLQDWADIVFLFDNDFRGQYVSDVASDQYHVQNLELTRIIEDFVANSPSAGRRKAIKEKVWEDVGLAEEFGSLSDDVQSEEAVAGKFIDFEKDPKSLLDGSNKWSVFGNYHPPKQFNNSYELLSASLSNVTSPLRYPLYGSMGVMFMLHNVSSFPDVGSVVKHELCKDIILRQFVYNPELHGSKGILLGGLGINWQNLPVLVELKRRAVAYAERYADDLIPEIFERHSRLMILERTEERKEKIKEDFRELINRTIFRNYTQRKEEAERKLLEGLDEEMARKIKEIMAKRDANNLSRIFEKETKSPNPFWVILEGDEIC